MKRSEMLNLIYQAFDDCLDIPSSSYLLKDGDDAADHILKAIENAGMKPPLAPFFGGSNEHHWEEENG
jgi:hypothetical protein